MSLTDDLHATAETAAALAIASVLPEVSPERLRAAGDAAVDAAGPFLDGRERRRVQEADSGGTVTS